MKTKLHRGFTIVELLIVIVVIGILAALVMNTFNGVQRKARNASRLHVAQTFKTTSQALTLERGTYLDLLADPDGDNFKTACIGTGFPDINGDGNGDCGYAASGWVFASEAPAFATEVAKISPVQKLSYPKFTRPNGGDTITYLAPFVSNVWLSGIGETTRFEYGLEGANQDCKMGPLLQWDVSNYWRADPGVVSSYVDGDTTICMIHIIE